MATHGRQRTVSNSGSVDKTAEMCLQISQKNQEQSSLLRLSVEVRFMIYGLLFEQDPKRNWVFSFKGEEWNPPSSPLIISDEDTWHKAPKHQVALFKACRQTQAETRPLIINTEKDAFEFWGFNALDRFAQTYASAQLTSLTFVAEIDDSHSPDLDNFVVLFQNAGFPKLKRMKIVAKDGERDVKSVLEGHPPTEAFLAGLRVIFDDFVDRLLVTVKSEKMELEIHCVTRWGFDTALAPVTMSAEGKRVPAWWAGIEIGKRCTAMWKDA